MTRLLLMLAVAAAPAIAQDDAQRRAKEELEKQLQKEIGKAPTRVKVEYVSLDDPNYVLEEAEFQLDGVSLRAPAASALEVTPTTLVWQGDATAGKHTLSVHVVYANKSSVVVSDEGGFKAKIGANTTFELNAGIEVQVKVTPTRVPGQRDLSKRFKLSLPATPVMIARLDDGTMPEPMKRPVVDAGVQVAALDPKAQAKADAEAKRLAAAEEKKAKGEAARLAKEEAARTAKEAAAAKAEARRLAAEEKKAKAAEAKLAKAEAARAAKEAKAEAVRLAKEEAERKLHPELAVAAVPDAGAPEPVAATPDAGAAVAEVVDAGAPVAVVAASPPDAGMAKPTAAPVEEGLPWLPIAGGAGALLVVLLIVIARRRSSVPKID